MTVGKDVFLAITNDFLASLPHFAGLDSSAVDRIRGLVFERSFEKGEVISWEGEGAEALYFIIAGAVKSFKTSEEGKEQIIQILLPGDSFNDVAVLDGGDVSISTEAMTPVSLCGVRKDDLEVIMETYPKVLANAVGVLTQRIRRLLELVEDLSFRHVINRIARVLLEYGSDGVGSRPRLTQQEMASIVGTAREVVGRSLKTLQQEGLIRMERNRLVIADKDALRQMANSETQKPV